MRIVKDLNRVKYYSYDFTDSDVEAKLIVEKILASKKRPEYGTDWHDFLMLVRNWYHGGMVGEI